MHESIEQAASEHNVSHALCFFLGGADASSRIVVGPEDGQADTIVPMVHGLGNVFEAVAVGTLFPNEAGTPVLHMHGAFGRGEQARSGCVRTGVDVWLVGEVVLLELLDCGAVRRADPRSGFELLDVDPQ